MLFWIAYLKIVRERVAIDRPAAFAAKCKAIRPSQNIFRELKKIISCGQLFSVPEEMSINGAPS